VAGGFTIAAAATPPARGGVGILRVSGGNALAVTMPLTPSVPSAPRPRYAHFTDLTDRDGRVLDQGLFLYFRAPHSYTGEDVVELHAHGSPRLLQLLQSELLRDERVRTAEPGEFTRRAFLNGRMDLARAEAVADMVVADSEAAVRASAHQLRGGLSMSVRELRQPLVSLRAELEGLLNFPVESEEATIEVEDRLREAMAGIHALLLEAQRGLLIRRGVRVVLAGPVNAGKSTLFNRLLGEARALVDVEPGTTRDLLEGRLELHGLAVSLFDTAGLRSSPGRVEALGIDRARAALRTADLIILLVPPEASDSEQQQWLGEVGDAPVLRVLGKSDLAPSAASRSELSVSGLTGAGVEALRERMVAEIWRDGAPQAVQLTSERHADALRRAAEALVRAQQAQAVSTLEVVSGELGLALEALGEITGESASDELLDAIFRRFCIGK
jgi:tRNA modification GTPase